MCDSVCITNLLVTSFDKICADGSAASKFLLVLIFLIAVNLLMHLLTWQFDNPSKIDFLSAFMCKNVTTLWLAAKFFM